MIIKYLKLGALLEQLHLFFPCIPSLTHVCVYVDNTAAQGWYNGVIISSASVFIPMLREIDLVTIQHRPHSSLRQVTSKYLKMVDAESCLAHLSDRLILTHFCHQFPKIKHW